MNEDKLFELMTKMYSDMNQKFDEINKKLDSKADKSDIVRLENKIDNNSKALFDGYKQNTERIIVLEKKVEDLSVKVEEHDIEIKAIKKAINL